MMDRRHNNPPLAARLELDYADLAERAAEGAALVPVELTPISTDDDAAAYAETAGALKEYVGTTGLIEKARKAEKDQILKDGRTVDSFFARIAEPANSALNRVLAEINRYQSAKLQAEREARRQAEEAARIFDAPAPVPVETKDVGRVVSVSGHVAATARTIWRHRVVDPEKIPRAYLAPNDAAIKAAIAGGVRQIDGIEIVEELVTAIRR